MNLLLLSLLLLFICAHFNCVIFFSCTIRYQTCTLLFDDHERTFNRLRARGVPTTPNSPEEIKLAFARPDIFECYGKTDHTDSREIFFDHVHVGMDFSYCIFSSKKIMQHIEKTPIGDRHYLIDATFKVVPFGCFTQLLIIHVGKYDTVHPFIYILMSNKSQRAYTHAFQYIDTSIFPLHCADFTTDYELAIRQSLRQCFPSSKLVACWFHYVQALRRKASKLSTLFSRIRSNSEVENLYYQFQALALLPADIIIETFEKLKAKAISLDSEAFIPFIEYFDRQWMRKVC